MMDMGSADCIACVWGRLVAETSTEGFAVPVVRLQGCCARRKGVLCCCAVHAHVPPGAQQQTEWYTKLVAVWFASYSVQQPV
jgi:hypothetical protein